MSFDYTTGNPNNLVGGTAANMLDIQGPFVDLKAFLNQRIAAIPTLVTNLPAGPVDGQEVYYLADSTNGVVWHLRYRSASGSASKWEFVGGSSLRAEVATSEAVGSLNTWVNLTTNGPAITAPLAGDYQVTFGLTVVIATATNQALSGVVVGDNTPTAMNQIFDIAPANGDTKSFSRQVVLTGVTAAGSVKMRYNANGGGPAYSQRYIELRPVRVG